ncbi:MAG: ceramidase domain-containing protein [Bdellovibrionales bacterium]
MNKRKWILVDVALAMAVFALSFSRIPQDPAYHLFADHRSLWGIANFGDVISNLAILLAGVLGLIGFKKVEWNLSARRAYLIFLFGICATCFGSMYYHLQPSTERLFWDRLPMTVAFMGFISLLITLRVSEHAGRILLVPLLIFGSASVVYWAYTESAGYGDLRPYALVQFGTMLIAVLIVAMFRGKEPRTDAIGFLALGYALAKLFEFLDAKIFSWTGEVISGHTLKHLFIGLGCCLFVILISCNYRQRKRISTV